MGLFSGIFWGLLYSGEMLEQTAVACIDPPAPPPFKFCSIKSPVCWKEQCFHVAWKPGVFWRGQNLGQFLTVTIDANLSTVPGPSLSLLH